jgi:hypothetical protein
MTERKLTSEQIDGLFTFVQGRGVSYYDVQMELVDHFASAIEQRWETNSEISYDEALQMEYRHFNRYDFNQIIKEKEQSLRQKYLNLQWIYIREYFRLPKIIAIVAASLVIFTGFVLINNFFKVYLLQSAIYMLVFLIYRFILFPWKYRLKLMSEKSFLLFEHYEEIKDRMNSSIFFPNFIASSIALFSLPEQSSNTYTVCVELFMAIYLAFSIIFVVATSKYVPQRIKADFTREFPKFVKS